MEGRRESIDEAGSYNERSDETNGDSDMLYTGDGSLDWLGRRALKGTTGGWKSGTLLLVSHGLAALSFVGVEVNLVLFATRVLTQSNAEAANTFSTWMGTVHFFSLIGAFLSDSYLGRFKTCVIFQVILSLGLALISISTSFFLLRPAGCGRIELLCEGQSSLEIAFFYISLYLTALGSGGYEPALATLGSDQFDEKDPDEKSSKIKFYSYYYVATNLGSLFSETALAYLEDSGKWVLSFWISASSSFAALVFLVSGMVRYRVFMPTGNPLTRFCQVIVAAMKKNGLPIPAGRELYEDDDVPNTNDGSRKLLHTDDFKCLDRAAIMTPEDRAFFQMNPNREPKNPWRLCTISQVEEVKCVLRLLPIWLCTIFYSAVFIQMFSLFLEQGAAMDNKIGSFHMPPASMTVFDIVSISTFILFYDKLIMPLHKKIIKNKPKEPSELQRMGIGFVVAIVGILAAALVEHQRLEHAIAGDGQRSSLTIFWQAPQYVLIGISEAFMYVGQMEFFGGQTPDGLKAMGIALSMSSMSIGSFLSSFLLSMVMKITSRGGQIGWIPPNLNNGRMDRFFHLTAGITVVNLVVYIWCARRFKSILREERSEARISDNSTF